MKDYELLLAVAEDQSEEEQKKLIKEITDSLEKQKANLKQTDFWGKRALAFSINNNSNASYWLLTFAASSNVPEELIKILKINDKVLRFLITTLELGKKVKTKKARRKKEEVNYVV